MSQYYSILAEGEYINPYQDATLAFSLRDLGLGAPHVVRVRRSIDNLEQDFTATEIIDGTLTSFCGAGDGFVVIFYDQSGNNNDAFKSVSIEQHQIVSNGSLIIVNGKPAIDGLDRNGYLLTNNINIKTVFEVSKIKTYTTLNYILGNESFNQGFYKGGTLSGVDGLGGFDGTNLLSDTNEDLFQSISYFNLRNNNLYVSKNNQNENNLGSFLASDMFVDRIFGRDATSRRYQSKYQELIAFAGDESAKQNLAKENINNFYNTYL